MVTHHHSLTKVLYKNVAVEQSFTGPITLKKKKKLNRDAFVPSF